MKGLYKIELDIPDPEDKSKRKIEYFDEEEIESTNLNKEGFVMFKLKTKDIYMFNSDKVISITYYPEE